MRCWLFKESETENTLWMEGKCSKEWKNVSERVRRKATPTLYAASKGYRSKKNKRISVWPDQANEHRDYVIGPERKI